MKPRNKLKPDQFWNETKKCGCIIIIFLQSLLSPVYAATNSNSYIFGL